MSQRTIELVVDSFWKLLIPGLTQTIPLTVISFAIAMVIAIAVAMVQFANIRGLKQLARFYIWIVRGTPLLVQLFLFFYGLPKLGIMLPAFPCAILVFSLNEGAYRRESRTVRNQILTDLGKVLLASFSYIPLYSEQEGYLLSDRVRYKSDMSVNSVVGYGGVRDMVYIMDDAEWAKYCKIMQYSISYE